MSVPPSAPLPPTRSSLAYAGRQLWLVDVLLAALIASGYLRHAPPPRGVAMGCFLYVGLVSCATTVTILPGLLLQWLALVRARLLLAWVSALVWTVTLVALFVDTQIYGIFRYHFNGMVWNVLTTPGADEAVHLEPGDLAVVLAGALVLLVLHAWVFLRLEQRARRRRADGRRDPRLLRPGHAWALVLVPAMLFVLTEYAWADLVRDRDVMALSRLYPVYPRLTVKGFFTKHLGYRIEEQPRVDVESQGILLDYPKRPIHVAPGGPRPNVLVVVIDSLRADMLAPDTMPNTTAFARGARVFTNHLSGGNATRFGIFSLIYGLHGSYWQAMVGEHRSPVLVDCLLELGYQVHVLTSASMSYPEFRSTAWVRVEDQVEDELKSPRPGARDDRVAERFDEWLGERPQEKPFFAFVVLDAPHLNYWFPEDEEQPFTPYAKDLSFLRLARGASDEERRLLFDRYRNAVHYSDEVVGRMLASLDRHGVRASTLVAITGDHGEEFFENGFQGHTSNFTPEQTHVPFVLSGPGVEPGEEHGPTSHEDFAPTLLEMLGLDPALRPDWCLGGNLFAPEEGRARVASGWSTLGLITSSGTILDVPYSATGGWLEVRDPHWRRVDDEDAVLRRDAGALAGLAEECRRFLR